MRKKDCTESCYGTIQEIKRRGKDVSDVLVVRYEVNGKQYSEYRTFRVAVLGDVGIFHCFPFDFRRRKDFFVTNLPAEERKSFPPSHEWVFFVINCFYSSVDYYEKLLVKDGICYRIIFCDFSATA